MKTIVIPGYSHKNKEWAETTAIKLSGKVYEWKHWSDPTVKFSASDEAKNILKIVGDAPIYIIAKSIGTYVTMKVIPDVKLGKLILCGICINDLNEDEKSEYKILSDIPAEKIIVFQNSEDEHGSFEDVRRWLSLINPNIKIVEKPGSTHEYPYYDEFSEFLGV